MFGFQSTKSPLDKKTRQKNFIETENWNICFFPATQFRLLYTIQYFILIDFFKPLYRRQKSQVGYRWVIEISSTLKHTIWSSFNILLALVNCTNVQLITIMIINLQKPRNNWNLPEMRRKRRKKKRFIILAPHVKHWTEFLCHQHCLYYSALIGVAIIYIGIHLFID